MTADENIPYVYVRGDAHERGLALGSKLKQAIHKTITFYEDTVFKNSLLSAAEICQRAEQIREIIRQFNPHYCVEIEAMAAASEVQAWRLYALNARTEVLNASVSECTSLVFKDSLLLGQTWDWIQQLEDLVVLVEHEYPDGQRLLTLTEPGMLAKIGMNDRGLGLCINILISKHGLNGVPVHILARAILETENLTEARKVIDLSGTGKSSHFLLGDATGAFLSVEFSGGSSEEIAFKNNSYIHTNHCLAENLCSELIPGTLERMTQGQSWLNNIGTHSISEMKNILLDNSGSGAIQAPYKSEQALGGLKVGTCATVIMELNKRILHLKKGPGKNSQFMKYSL